MLPAKGVDFLGILVYNIISPKIFLRKADKLKGRKKVDIIKKLTEEFNLKEFQVKNTVELIDSDNTIPFIARYRKEMTGSLDDQVLRELYERLNYLRGLEKRKAEVSAAIAELEKLTPELEEAINTAKTLAEIEDLYRPYKQKRKTRASVARERGLEPLAVALMEQKNDFDPDTAALEYINEQVPDGAAALAGAMDIIAEDVSDRADIRKKLRAFYWRTGLVRSKAANPEAESVYTMYYDFSEPVNKIAGHRLLAIDRGTREEFLKSSVAVTAAEAQEIILKDIVKAENKSSEYVKAACADSYTRLISPSIEREIYSMLLERASTDAIKVFSANLRQLLLQPPVKNTVTLGLDPAYRTGCKIAVVDCTGKVLDTTVVYPTPPQSKTAEAEKTLTALIEKHGVTAIAIGNGTASRESETFVAGLIKKLKTPVSYMIVSEAGASVYSASKLAAAEFPQFDVSLRSAVSIARRMQDPLAELVKIDPKSIGVGQYQHDMPKNQLDGALSGVVEDCVNLVGVDLNTASQSLLERVSGINAGVAKNIYAYREENGAFKNRKELMKVPKLGAKAFTQCAGFMRVSGGDNILDNTGVHPESYKAASNLIKLCGYDKDELQNGRLIDIKERAKELGIEFLCEKLEVGEPTVNDIITELSKPGRDPRDELPPPLLRSDVLELKDIKPGMELKGTVRNVIDFGAFVDIGVHEDGLVHISQICDRYIKHPLEVLNVGDVVTVWVLSVDVAKKRIGLTMKEPRKEKNNG